MFAFLPPKKICKKCQRLVIVRISYFNITSLHTRVSFCFSIHPSISKTNVALLLFLGFAGFSLLIAWCYKAMRRLVYRDSHSLDTVFDAGGQVTFSLTAVTVTSQLLWPADFLQSSTLMSKVSIVYSLGRSNEGVSNLKNNLK